MLREDILPKSENAVSERWDREWMSYLSTESVYPHIVEAKRLELRTDLVGLTREQVFNTQLVRDRRNPDAFTGLLRIWSSGDELVGRDVVEIGCGCGMLGKQIGLVANSYLGIDHSQLALAIARGSSPSNCVYLHVSDREEIERHAGAYDIMVGREFFIHQNYENALWVLRLGSFLLRNSGVISADFYWPDASKVQGVVHPAHSSLDPKYASCAFVYSDDELRELASEAGLLLEQIEIYTPHQRKFTRFRKIGRST